MSVPKVSNLPYSTKGIGNFFLPFLLQCSFNFLVTVVYWKDLRLTNLGSRFIFLFLSFFCRLWMFSFRRTFYILFLLISVLSNFVFKFLPPVRKAVQSFNLFTMLSPIAFYLKYFDPAVFLVSPGWPRQRAFRIRSNLVYWPTTLSLKNLILNPVDMRLRTLRESFGSTSSSFLHGSSVWQQKLCPRLFPLSECSGHHGVVFIFRDVFCSNWMFCCCLRCSSFFKMFSSVLFSPRLLCFSLSWGNSWSQWLPITSFSSSESMNFPDQPKILFHFHLAVVFCLFGLFLFRFGALKVRRFRRHFFRFQNWTSC